MLTPINATILLAMKRLSTYSQHFIRNPALVSELLRRSTITARDTVYDIGAGSGVITSELAKKAKQVVAIELEPRTAEILRRNVKNLPNVIIKTVDARSVALPDTPYKIFANIPFHISSDLVRRFINSPNAPIAAYLIVQKQFGRKLVASDTTHFTSQLGMIIGAEYSVRVFKQLRRTDFWPHPAVDTVCIEMIKRPEPLVPKKQLAAYARFTEACFADPKKLAKAPLAAIGATAGISPSRLSLDRWVALFNATLTS